MGLLQFFKQVKIKTVVKIVHFCTMKIILHTTSCTIGTLWETVYWKQCV